MIGPAPTSRGRTKAATGPGRLPPKSAISTPFCYATQAATVYAFGDVP